MSDEIWTDEQKKLCQEFQVPFVPCDMLSKMGISRDTNISKLPINGLRHPTQGDTSGWYLWSGDELSDEDDFFEPLHVFHLIERCPEVIRFLGLPPGYRFLIAGEYKDVWYDESLLDI